MERQKHNRQVEGERERKAGGGNGKKLQAIWIFLSAPNILFLKILNSFGIIASLKNLLS